MIDGKKVLAITLARGGSKRVPQKNKKIINSKPLIQYTIDEIKSSKYIDKYIVASDDEDILKIANDLEVGIYRRNLVSDTQTTSEGLIEVIDYEMELESWKFDFDIIVEVMCTNPLKTVEDIDGTIEKILEGDSAVSVIRVWDQHPSRIKFIEDGVLKDVYPEIPESRRQDLFPAAYMRNGSIYVMYTKDLIENEKRLSGKIIPFVMSQENTINIDEPIDFIVADQLLKQRCKN